MQPLFVTVDPERDTPKKLAEYIKSFHASLIALSGSEQQISAVARAYKVHRRKVIGAGGDSAGYLVDHSSLTYLMGPDGQFRTLIPHNTSAAAMAATIGRYLD